MSKKLFFILLLALFIMQTGAVSYSLIAGNSDTPSGSDSQVDYPIMEVLDKLLERITPSLFLENQFCNQQSVQTRFQLNGDGPSCAIELCGDCVVPASGEIDSARHRRGKLVIYDSDAVVYSKVSVPKNQKPDECVNNLPAVVNQQKILAINFAPNNVTSKPDNISCWLKKTGKSNSRITLSVQEAGAILELDCLSCVIGGQVRLSLF